MPQPRRARHAARLALPVLLTGARGMAGEPNANQTVAPTTSPTVTPVPGTYVWVGEATGFWNDTSNWFPQAGAPPSGNETAVIRGDYNTSVKVTSSRAAGQDEQPMPSSTAPRPTLATCLMPRPFPLLPLRPR